MSEPGGPSIGGGGHPEDLRRIDRAYLAPWGRREVLLSAAGSGTAAALLASVALEARGAWSWIAGVLLIPVLALGALLVLFFRNPRRRIPTEPGLLVSPADGTVVEVERVEEGEFIRGPALKIGIFLSIFNVHVNRAPCAGRVERLDHRPGRYLDARDPRSARENECQAIGIAMDGASGLKILVRQISGAIARRIVCPLALGARLERGGLIGMIKYGSRTELYVALPGGGAAVEPAVKVGDGVKGGESILVRLQAKS